MPPKKSPGRIKRIRQRVQQRIASSFQGRAAFLKSGAVQRVFLLFPTPVRRMLPFVMQEFQPEIDGVRGLMGRKKGESEAEVLEGIAAETALPTSVSQFSRSLDTAYGCVEHNPLNCPWSQQTTVDDPEQQYCFKCGFPAILATQKQIRGSRAVYQIESFGRDRGLGRYYQAVQLPDRQPIILKEYLLPKKYFNQAEISIKKANFEQLSNMDLADGRQIQDFRLLSPLEAISDTHQERCYLIFRGDLYGVPTLASYLQQTGVFSNIEVFQVLQQVLQSLQFLHSQKFRVSGNLMPVGMTHGNINLDSLLIVPHFQGFFIYLTDLALWEDTFDFPTISPEVHSPPEDLKALGYVAFYLLAGSQINFENNQPLKPENDSDWPANVNPNLKVYILNLMGLGIVNYSTAEVARRNLENIPIFPSNIQPETLVSATDIEDKKQSRRWRLLLLGVIGLLVLAALILIASRRNQQVATPPEITQESISDVVGVPTGEFSYFVEPGGTWEYILTQPNILQNGQKLPEIIALQQPELQLDPQLEPDVLEALTLDSPANFAITTLIDDSEIDPQIARSIFAYDGLVIFVPFSYTEREKGLPHALDGKISFKQLRQLYTGQITNWQELGGPNLPVKLYVPAKAEALRIFEQRVLQDEAAIATFRELIRENTEGDRFFISPTQVAIAQVDSTPEMLRSVIRDFENANEPVGSLGFDTFSEVFGQCSVYPLALTDGSNGVISPLIQNNQEPVTPTTDLCNDKGSYAPHQNAFIYQKYPLAYPLAVIYPRDNRQEPVGEKFAEILRTAEIQEVLQEIGLIPLEPR